MSLRELEIEPFIAQDLQEISPRPFDSDWIDKFGLDIMEDYGILEDIGPAYTGRYKDRIVFCAGIRILWSGVGEVWSIGDRIYAKRYAKEMFYYQDSLLAQEVINRPFHRLQAHVLKKWKGACKYMERLGFHREGLLEKYGPSGEDYILYARG